MYFSSGPSKKPYLINDSKGLNRSHRSSFWKRKIEKILLKIKSVLKIPKEYQIAFIPGSSTGAMEALLWNLLGYRKIDVVVYDIFSEIWTLDLGKKLNLEVNKLENEKGKIPDLKQVNSENDLVFIWNGTTIGVSFENADFISDKRGGLTICDASSAAFCIDLPWTKLDATAFSFQKGLGGEGGIGCVVLSPRALERLHLESKNPVPYLLDMRNFGEKIFKDFTINTPSLLTLIDLENCLIWAEKQGGIEELAKKVKSNFAIVERYCQENDFLNLLWEKDNSRVSPCVVVDFFKTREDYENFSLLLQERRIAFDILGHNLTPPCLRFWCGPTIDCESIEKAFGQVVHILKDNLVSHKYS